MTHKTLIETDWHGNVTREIENDYHLEGIDIEPIFVYNRIDTFISIISKIEYIDYSRMALCQDSLSFRLYTVSRMIDNHEGGIFTISQADEPLSEVWRVDVEALLQGRQGASDIVLNLDGEVYRETLTRFAIALDKTCYNSEKAIDLYLFHAL